MKKKLTPTNPSLKKMDIEVIIYYITVRPKTIMANINRKDVKVLIIISLH